ncbi:MAG: tRNA (guanosine(37)-N1)-methyltransferase TrmD [Candidatus Portnoybacteria bacterium CG09_land_8_20_14_0_10_44_13]|uniref:tRNA (guanine-N(1)-)-methyltransferase n=4 Tax=Candidatus Portnoyibacteriota TaxID=1817913 RepID=A0A2H0KRR8_9BACT|nr:MAG: tRNA (guanosine(37)-N1)-methyltransferase TrmD [Candidatus Portnoybacteria bacterium CG11_big_fil_rev_8_21_14_0_20_44_10]PIS16994.1 MAG: tRNA (guanosine(37)-N1)-methyltransferase TrmD [Candidatus Portnoybacteria bacterium CG09_land_8_20_14_0_10_44_13]PIZ70609.1 MAG: tRNA (guanosine(37)-N1)-methyltransferase TrmD [Candidatus Portnoybacteria bacterium CG_4_10_14_0_2_um_filter_44_20]
MKFDIITIFPKIFNGYFGESIIGRAQEKKLIKLRVHDLRDFTIDKRRTVDDKPYGGGPGMILKIEPISKAIAALRALRGKGGKKKVAIKNLKPKRRVILFSAKGKTVTQADVRRLAKYDQLILICGRYEGVDERVAKYIADEEISVGNYVLTGGEIPAMIMVDAVSRLIPGVLGKRESLDEESFNGCLRTTDYGLRSKRNFKAVAGSRLAVDNNYLEYPQYTRPEEFMGWRVPKVLLSGNHMKIKEWRKKISNSPNSSNSPNKISNS